MNILDKIIKAKKSNLPIGEELNTDYNPKPFLKKDSFQIIAEIKKGSPSLGLLKPDLDIKGTSLFYEKNGASAVSVLTEEDYFYGSLDDLKLVRNSITLPILRKDFIFTREQVFESRNNKADAILLIVSVLKTTKKLKELLSLSSALGMSTLVEVHNKEELEIALNAGSAIIGINNRCLNTFKTDIQISINLISLIPKHIITVSESGIHTMDDIRKIKSAGFDAVLIGSAFIQNKNFLKELGSLLC